MMPIYYHTGFLQGGIRISTVTGPQQSKLRLRVSPVAAGRRCSYSVVVVIL